MSWIFERIKENHSKDAIVYDDCIYSYGELGERIEYYLEKFEGVIGKGNIVAILSDYTFESIAVFFALFKNENIIVPIVSKTETEIKERLEEAKCDFSIVFEGDGILIDKLDNSKEVHAIVKGLQETESSGLILFSSGSTGKPKAMIHNLDNLINTYENKKGKKLVFLIFLMFDHIGGLNTMFNCISMGVSMVYPINRDPDYICKLIEKYEINILPASPTFLNLILISGAYETCDLSSVRMITYGTEPMPESLLLKLKEVFRRVKFLQTFGTSETGIMQLSSKSSTSTEIKIDDPNTEYKIVEGELWIRSKTQVLGYLNASMERFTNDGWFKTGDLVEESADGFIKIVGRNAELINVGGEKVLPSEVESILLQMDNIKDCVVFGEPNPITGQIVSAKVLLKEDIKVSAIKKEIQVFCKNRLDRYKIPVRIIKMEESQFTDRFKKKRL